MQSLMQNSKTDLQIDLNQIRIDILKGIRECEVRGLKQTTKWLSELNYALKDYKINYDEFPATFDDGIVSEEKEAYALAKSYFDCQEYDRAAHFLENCNSQKCIFLHKYSQYLSSEKKKLDNATEPGSEKTEYTQALLDLLSFFKANHNNLDGYLLYLEGVVLKKLDLRSQAVASLQAAVTSVPILWCAWVELASLSDKYEALDTLQLPKHWMMNFFTPHTLIELKLPEQALEIYTALVASGFDKSTYITAQMAIAHHDRRDVESSLALFRELYQTDPYRIDNWDVYSHSLFLLEKRMELANLAQRAASIDKYRVETCCVIGNYYSLRGEHQKAVIYFQRALSLDPQYLSAWILMGHEYIELQNANAAIQSYRQATDVNRNDYRAWNGLGQAYEILGLNSYCIYYYSRAAQLKPDDSRMLVSLGEAYEKMDKIANALKCYCKAHSTGDIEGMALFKLAKLYEKSDMPNNAAAAYTTACQDPANAASKDLPSALRYLAQYYFRFSLYDHSAQYAYKCLEHESTKEIGKDILKSISEHRLTARSAQAANSSDDVTAAKPYDKSGAGSIDRDCPVTMDSLPRALDTPQSGQSGVPLDTPQSALTLDTPQSGVSLDTPREGSLNTPHTPGTPLPGPHVTPDNFSTPVFTRKNKYKM